MRREATCVGEFPTEKKVFAKLGDRVDFGEAAPQAVAPSPSALNVRLPLDRRLQRCCAARDIAEACRQVRQFPVQSVIAALARLRDDSTLPSARIALPYCFLLTPGATAACAAATDKEADHAARNVEEKELPG